MDTSKNRSKNAVLQSSKTVIRTKNFTASVDFYTQLLKLTLIENYNDGDGSQGAILRLGPEDSNAFIEISEIDKTHSYYQEPFGEELQNDKIDIQLKTNDVTYWENRLEGKCKMRGPVLRPWGSYYLYIRDPDGLQIIIYQEKSK
ncbi:VOC family protein [Aquimarina sp. 2201CG1-2-11]|uniref:VOC family protein n=1 Tax=Aquimarina discodermiae TaxID=3231043 RepID=UPI003462D43B